jgi:Cation efflux family
MAFSAPGNGRTTNSDNKPSNEYVLNVAFFSFLGFVLVQAVFAIIARSEAMLADSEAMMVDALTYLFNLMAERIKNRPLTDDEMRMSPSCRHYQRELRRLYLELIPPSISVLTLLAVTFFTIREASDTLRNASEDEEEQGEGDSVSLPLMLTFSAANLLLDIVNVTCFARANLNFGLETVRREQFTINDSLFGSNAGSGDAECRTPATGQNLDAVPAAEATPLLATASTSNGRVSHRRRISSSDLYQPTKTHEIVNLNMCSAWTVSLVAMMFIERTSTQYCRCKCYLDL